MAVIENCFTVFEGSQTFVRNLKLKRVNEWSWIAQNGDVLQVDGAHSFSAATSASDLANWGKKH